MFLQKLKQYILCLIISTVLMIPITRVYTEFTDGVLFFSAFLIAILSSIAGFLLWQINNKNYFENFLVLMTFILFNALFIYLGPVSLDRSLSSFIYFYSVENKNISQENIFNEAYFKPYINRRFEDGEKIGFLECTDNRICTPKLKTKIAYYILYPLAKLTGTLDPYKEFKKKMDEIKNEQN